MLLNNDGIEGIVGQTAQRDASKQVAPEGPRPPTAVMSHFWQQDVKTGSDLLDSAVEFRCKEPRPTQLGLGRGGGLGTPVVS